jgi:hypothetical protein
VNSKFYSFICVLISCVFINVSAEIIEISTIRDIRQEVSKNILILFNVAEVVMDSSTSLGTQAWRKWIRQRLSPELHDRLSLFVFEHIPQKCPESEIVEWIRHLQSQGIVALGFTSRGRSEWYGSAIPDVDTRTELRLLELGIDFSQTRLSNALVALPQRFPDYYRAGVIYTGNSRDKGELLAEIFSKTQYTPSKIIYIDDKKDSLQEVQQVMQAMGIPFVGYQYTRTARDHRDFDPLVAAIQFAGLISQGQVLTDAEAIQIKNERFCGVDGNRYFDEQIKKWLVLSSP